MTENIWFPFYLGAYAKRAGHLSQGQHGAFISLLRYYYTNQSPIPDDERYAIAYANALQEQCNTDFVLNKFFTLVNGFWHSSKADEIIRGIAKKSKERRKAAKTRWSKVPSKSNANALQLDIKSKTESLSKDKEGSPEENIRYGLGGRRPKIQNAKAMAEASTPEEFLKALGEGK